MKEFFCGKMGFRFLIYPQLMREIIITNVSFMFSLCQGLFLSVNVLNSHNKL